MNWNNFAADLESFSGKAHALIVYSEMKPGFCAGADYSANCFPVRRNSNRARLLRACVAYLERIHRVLNTIDASPLTTMAATHGVTFGGGFELALCLRSHHRRQDDHGSVFPSCDWD